METSRIFRHSLGLLIVCLFLLVEGCYTNTVRVESNPPGAQVHFDYKPVGNTPVEFTTDWLGKHRLTLDHPGYNQHVETVTLKSPAYLWFPLDFFVAILPFKHENRYEFSVNLKSETGEGMEAVSDESKGTQEP